MQATRLFPGGQWEAGASPPDSLRQVFSPIFFFSSIGSGGDGSSFRSASFLCPKTCFFSYPPYPARFATPPWMLWA